MSDNKAVLFWGFPFPQQDQVPWESDEGSEQDIDQWEARFRRRQPVIEPATLGCKLDSFGRPANFSFYYATVTQSEFVAYEEEPSIVNFPPIQPEWESNLKEFCTILGLPWETPQWYLAASIFD